MKLKNIIKLVSEMLNVQDEKIIKRCANLVLGNIASNHRDCIAKQTFTVTNGRIDYSEFNRTFLKIVSIKSGGRSLEYSLFVDFIEVQNGQITVEYAFVPVFESENSSVAIPGITEQTFVYGVLTEYAIISGMVNEAKIWNHKFEEGLFATNIRNKNIILPKV